MLFSRTPDPTVRSAGRPAVLATVLAALTGMAILAAGCGSSGSNADGPPVKVIGASASAGSSGGSGDTTYRGDHLSQPVALTTASQTARFDSSAGGTTTLGDLQKRGLMLVYFGYTHCPDVCPTTMADLGDALRQLPTQIQAHTQVVFVTADPDRDTPAVMKTWLSNFDNNLVLPFVGLTAKVQQIDTVAKSVGVPLEPPVKNSNGSVTVEHGAQTLAFRSDSANLVWTADTSAADYGHDISVLLTNQGGG